MTNFSRYLAARKRRPVGQFGQVGDVSTWNGATGCGQTCVQTVIYAIKGVMPTHDQVSKAAGYWRPRNQRGTSAEMLAKALNHWLGAGKYKAVYGLSTAQLIAFSRSRGPVLVSVRYPRYPNWRAYRGARPAVPYALPLGHAGRNQFYGNFTHWTVIAGVSGAPYAGYPGVMEPNHRSPARPEAVVLDYVKAADLNRAVLAAFPRTIAVIPTRVIA
jgi:hypothetical protein